MKSFRFTVQTTYQDESAFLQTLSTLQEAGCFGLELNLPVLDMLPAETLSHLLDTFRLKLTYLATGAYAKQNSFSLSAKDASLRARSVDGCMQNIDYAARMSCGIILGFYKSSPSVLSDGNLSLLLDSLEQLADYAAARKVPILLEATNRYESPFANTLQDTALILKELKKTSLFLLPDTYHMNIEESDPFDALLQVLPLCRNIHFSDNNRFFPGYGNLNFASYLSLLRDHGYHGTIGIEGNKKHTEHQDILYAMNYLHHAPVSSAKYRL